MALIPNSIHTVVPARDLLRICCTLINGDQTSEDNRPCFLEMWVVPLFKANSCRELGWSWYLFVSERYLAASFKEG